MKIYKLADTPKRPCKKSTFGQKSTSKQTFKTEKYWQYITMRRIAFVAFCLAIEFAAGQYNGILINGYYGTQTYDDPFMKRPVRANRSRLPQEKRAVGGAAVISGNLAYFGGGENGRYGQIMYLHHILLPPQMPHPKIAEGCDVEVTGNI